MSLIKYFLLLSFTSIIIAQDCKSELVIKSDFNSVNIFINDSLVSDNGYFVGKIEKGNYKIVADEVSDRWNSITFIDTIIIDDCNLRKELLFLFKEDSIKTQLNQHDSTDFINKKYYLSEKAYKEIDFSIPNKVKKEKFVDSHLFKIFTVTSIVLGGVTAYYKIKADKLFDEYLSSRDKSKLDQTKKYDLISGITLAAFQINFSYILLRFLLE
ncbi:MAG: hypothetical protein NZM09_05060 [Ignavibacterium sp.]|nr:hypothetical protein [Ignavibacterium sp.]MDW8375045.1 hypothetical protein [Ignavibacteriales bacterium]